MTSRANLEEALRLSYILADRVSSSSLRHYLEQVVIDCRPLPARFGDVAEEWQWTTLGPILPAMESVAGVRQGYEGPRSFWRTLTRGSDKTSSIGRIANWLLGYSKKKLSICVAASDLDQAAILMDAMRSEAEHNPWLKKVRHGKKASSGPGGKLSILSSDAGSSFGRNDDVIIIDELTHWTKKDLFDVLLSGSKKRPGAVVVIITNAGTMGSWQWELWQQAKETKTWDVWDAPGPMASWMTAEGLAEIRKGLPRGLARRVLDNVWIDPAEEADYLTRKEIVACQELGGTLGLSYQTKGQAGIRYALSVDYGPRRDRTALCVGHRNPNGIVIVDCLDVWQGDPQEPIKIQDVERWLREKSKAFHHPEIIIDPYQMEGTIQDFSLDHKVERHEARGGKSNYEMAETFRSLIVNKQIAWYKDAGTLLVKGRRDTLEDEIAGLVIKQTPYGYRFDHLTSFHDDRAVALGMLCLQLCRMDPSAPGAPPPPLRVKEPTRLVERNPTWERRGLWGVR